ncbi:hypothetical protein, partial [Ensifer sp.]|uniref:hypothetical protein n=1 Tax=Ensifer sp. TaxID=1872086 RepID=UPI002E10FD90|nr:hypothetical protein [Ensifer sp.]
MPAATIMARIRETLIIETSLSASYEGFAGVVCYPAWVPIPAALECEFRGVEVQHEGIPSFFALIFVRRQV